MFKFIHPIGQMPQMPAIGGVAGKPAPQDFMQVLMQKTPALRQAPEAVFIPKTMGQTIAAQVIPVEAPKKVPTVLYGIRER